MFKIEKNYILMTVCLAFFVLITFPYMITHIPHCDESQNYMAAWFMTISNFMEILKSHGHPILWYLIIMPFAKLNLAYPYSILIINYIFTLASLIFMWLKAPFNNTLKIIVTFSFMMISYFAIVARCYSIGILGLFILAYLFKEQTKKPVIYAIMLVLTANTSAIASIGVSGLSFLFLFNLFKERNNIKKSKIIISLLILFTFGIFCVLPHITYDFHFLAEKESFEMFFFPLKNNLTFICGYITSIILLVVNGLKNRMQRQSVFFLLYTLTLQLLFMTFVYCCFQHHNYFFLIWLIMTVWIQNSYKPYENGFSQILYVLLALLLFTPNDLSFKHGNPIVYEYGRIMEKDSSKYDNSVIMFVDNPDNILFQIAPFFINNKTVTLMNGNEPYSYVMKWFVPNGEEIQRNIESFNKPVYIFASMQTDLPQYELIENYKDTIKVYKAK